MSNLFDDKQLYPLLFQDNFSKIKSFLDKYGLDSVDRDGRSFLTNCIAEHKNLFAKQLIELGADINQQDNDGSTPFHAAVRAKNTEMIDLLLTYPDLNINGQDEYGRNVLGAALQNDPKDNDLMIKLIKSGVNPFLPYKDGRTTPYSIAKSFESGERTIGGKNINIEPVIREINKLNK